MNVDYIKNLKTPIALIGLGKSGLSAQKLLLSVGFSEADLILFDEKSSMAHFQNWDDSRLLGSQTYVVSPGVPLKNPFFKRALAEGKHITSEISLAASLLTTEKIIGVTGSVGKSTVTSLLGEALRTFDQNAFVGGNLGVPFCEYALNLVLGKEKAQWIVLELSSYQLENCPNLKLNQSIITYLSANHLERYESLEEYYSTKLHITQMTTGTCLFNQTSADAVIYSTKAACAVQFINAELYKRTQVLPQLMMIGSHNQDNFSLAAQMAKNCGWPEVAIEKMTKYKGLSHRLEFVGTVHDVAYIDDSKATAINSVLVAVSACLEALTENNNLFVLLGGQDKNLPWNELSLLSRFENVIPVFFGACGELAKSKTNLSGEYFAKLGHAIQYCQRRAQAHDVVLLSPGGTSLDEFKNFEERGNFFKSLVLAAN